MESSLLEDMSGALMRPRHLAPLLVTLALSADMATAEPVKGRVSDGAGRPIGGVEVRVESAGPPAAVTGADGAFALAGLAPRRDL
ncbi:MAG TPA: carboxypeptidase-like regulatory domain-containing protein, partial [Acidimicrobiales bacterium]|nr:carboxypeptidase-like regulatory domain-containing protein [Acidimicrobiales bacterium]